MNVRVLTRAETGACAARALGLVSADVLSAEFIAQSVRRALFILAPCRRFELAQAVTKALKPIAGQDPAEAVDAMIEELTALGDTLLMNADGAAGTTGAVLRPAPPTFVQRGDGACVVLGVAGDDISPPLEDGMNIVAAGAARFVRAGASDPNIAARLRALGLNELHESDWLHQPAAEEASAYLARWSARLGPHSGASEDLEVLDGAAPQRFYKGRWTPLAKKHSGLYVARRPKRFGNDLWSLIDVTTGAPRQLADIEPELPRARSCDEAWRIQAALDATRGRSAPVECIKDADTTTIAMFAPPPLWLARRFALVGKPVKVQGALAAFEFPASAAGNEVGALKRLMWCDVLEKNAA